MREASEQPAVIGRGITVRGDLAGEGDIVVEGRIEGRVDLISAFTVAEGGEVAADIRARSVAVYGRVRGNVEASERFTIGPTGIVSGDVRAGAIAIEEGAVIRGRIDMDVDVPADLLSTPPGVER